MRGRAWTCTAAFVLLVTAGCSTAEAERTMDAASDGPEARLSALTTLDHRVAGVAWRLATANLDLCPATAATAGWFLHSATQYGGEIRPVAERRFGLRGDLPGVLTVGADSPAARAGLRTGDLITAIDGVELDQGEAARQSFDGLAANIAVVDAALANGSVAVDVERGDERMRLTVQPMRACDYRFQVDPATDLGARADGRGVFISSRLAQFAAADDDLAFVLAHEMAHNVLQHKPPRDAQGNPLPRREGGLQPGDPRNAERDADRVGLYLMARAGYDTTQAPLFMLRFAEANWQVRHAQIGHASASTRAGRLEAVQAEIVSKRLSGAALIP